MHREPGGDIIEFNDLDQRRFPCLPDWAPAEAIPGIFEDVMTAQAETAVEIQRLNDHAGHDRSYAEHLVELQQAHLRAVQLQAVAKDLGEIAGAELLATMVPDAI